MQFLPKNKNIVNYFQKNIKFVTFYFLLTAFYRKIVFN